MADEREYVLGTHDEEIARLGLQHRVWRPRALDAWLQAGFTTGQTLVDVGCGPGYATIDLAEITGPSGRVVAIDRSQRFLDALAGNAARRCLPNIEIVNAELDGDGLPDVAADGVWVRWVFAFVRQPRELLARIVRLLKPGGGSWFTSTSTTPPGAWLRARRCSNNSYRRSWPPGAPTAASPISAWTSLAG